MKKLIGLVVVAVLFSATISAQETQKVEKKVNHTTKQASVTEKSADQKVAVTEKKEVKTHKTAHKAKKMEKKAETPAKQG